MYSTAAPYSIPPRSSMTREEDILRAACRSAQPRGLLLE